MSKISLAPDASGTGIFTIASPNSNTNRTLTLPDDTGTIVTNSGNQAGSFTTLNTSGAVVFNDAGADVDFRVESDTVENALFVDGATGNIGVGRNSPGAQVEVSRSATDGFSTIRWSNTGASGRTYEIGLGGNTASAGFANNLYFYDSTAGATRMVIDSNGKVGIGGTPLGRLEVADVSQLTTAGAWASATLAMKQVGGFIGDYSQIVFGYHAGTQTWGSAYMGFLETNQGTNGYGDLVFGTRAVNTDTQPTERMRITSAGVVQMLASGSVANRFAVTGIDQGPLAVNRTTSDGGLVEFYKDGVLVGEISVSSGVVSYNPFLGSHAGALADWSKPEIKIGTVMDTIDELLEYKVVVIDVQEEVPAKEAVMDKDGNEVEPAQEATTQTVQKRISYNGNGAVGSTATVEYGGQEYTGIIHNEREEPYAFNKHLKVKINDTAASKAVFGVFVGWNNDSNNDGGVYNDMLVGAVGNYVIRMAAGQEPQIGDLVEADGNGCAVVQDDDIIRTKTIAKVTSTIKQVTYDDGSFLVTCVLYCG